ncbi:MAG: O-antigen ligase family protein [Parcubacteria group bacterium]|nr:O-antigen ligase family protein [Parcubacteria group bacterium]
MTFRGENKSLWIERIARYSVYLVLLVPLLSSDKLFFPYSSTKGYVIMALVEIAVVATLWLLVVRPQRRISWDPISIALTAFVGILELASIFGVDPTFSFWASIDRITGGLMWLHILALYFIVRILFQTKEDWVKLFTVSVGVGLITAGIHLAQLAGIEFSVGSNGGSTLGNSSFFAAYILFQIAFAAWIWLEGADKRMRTYGAVSMFALIGTLLSISTHASIIAFFGALVLVLGVWLWGSAKEKVSRGGIGLLIVMVVTFFSIVGLAFVPDSVVQNTFTDFSTSSRFVVWDMAVQAIKDRPFLGWGLENFQYVSLEYYNPCLGTDICGQEMWYDRAHNKLLDVGVEAGIIGLLSYLAVFVVTLLALGKMVVSARHSRVAGRSLRGTAAIAVGILAAYFVQNLTVLDISVTMMLWVLTLAWISSVGSWGKKPESSKRPTWIVPPALLVSFFLPVILSSFVIHPVRANAALMNVVHAKTYDERLTNLPIALDGSPEGEDLRRVFLANDTARNIWATDPEGLSALEEPVNYEIDLLVASLLDTMENSPNYLRAPLAIALLAQARGRLYDVEQFALAEQVLLDAIELNPVHPKPYWALASVYLEQGKVDEALELLDEVRTFAPDLDGSHYKYVMGVMFLQNDDILSQVANDALADHPGILADLQRLLSNNIEQNKVQILYQFHL